MKKEDFKNLVLEFLRKGDLYYITDENIVKEVYNVHDINIYKTEIDFTKNTLNIVSETRSLMWFSEEHLKELCEKGFCATGGHYFCLGEEGCISALSFHNNKVLNSALERIESNKQTVEKIKELDKEEYTRQWNLYFNRW